MLSDPNSAANFNSFSTSHLHLNLAIDFSAQILAGFVEISLKRLDDRGRELLFDAAKLNVKSITLWRYKYYQYIRERVNVC